MDRQTVLITLRFARMGRATDLPICGCAERRICRASALRQAKRVGIICGDPLPL